MSIIMKQLTILGIGLAIGAVLIYATPMPVRPFNGAWLAAFFVTAVAGFLARRVGRQGRGQR